MIDREGKNQRQITFGDNSASKPLWSPDGKLVAYYSRKVHEPGDSEKVYVINPNNLAEPQMINQGRHINWVDSSTLLVWNKFKTWVASLDGKSLKEFSNDSILACPVLNNAYVIFYRSPFLNDAALWIIPSVEFKGGWSHRAKRLISQLRGVCRVSHSKRFILYYKDFKEL